MIYNFDTKNENAALGALIVYGCYRSRDISKFKVSPDMWGIIERAAKSCAKRADDLNDFIEKFKKKVSCTSLKPSYMMAHTKSPEILVSDGYGNFITKEETGGRKFWLNIIEDSDNQKAIEELYKHTSFIIILVRDRLEREKYLRELGKLEEEEENDEEI